MRVSEALVCAASVELVRIPRRVALYCGVIGMALVALDASFAPAQSNVVKSVLPTTVKIFGSGGMQGLEAYQTGVIISAEGHVLTVWSYVLDNETSTVTTNDGEKFRGKIIGHDPRLEIAILKIEGQGMPHFDLNRAATVSIGQTVLAFSNCYGVATGDEPVSVQRGVVSAKTRLSAKRGAWEIPYTDDVLILDAITSNPGSAGGIVTDSNGQLVAIIGKESKDSRSGTWLNYAIPIERLTESITKILDGKKLNRRDVSSRRVTEPMNASLLGFELVPQVVRRTPPYIDSVRQNTSASRAGIMADDLIVEINGNSTGSCLEVVERLNAVDRDAPLLITVQRKSDFLTFKLSLVESD